MPSVSSPLPFLLCHRKRASSSEGNSPSLPLGRALKSGKAEVSGRLVLSKAVKSSPYLPQLPKSLHCIPPASRPRGGGTEEGGGGGGGPRASLQKRSFRCVIQRRHEKTLSPRRAPAPESLLANHPRSPIPRARRSCFPSDIFGLRTLVISASQALWSEPRREGRRGREGEKSATSVPARGGKAGEGAAWKERRRLKARLAAPPRAV